MKIGVFDSGIGGKSVANAIQAAMPELTVVFRPDTPDHFPYATKSPDEIYGFVVPVIDQLIAEGCALVVIACNTVSTTLIDRLRERFSTPLIAVEPMVKQAAEQTKTGIITVCATPTTLASTRYADLKASFAQDITVIEPDCSDWSSLIERNEMNVNNIRKTLEQSLVSGSDVIVLGCTHYHWIEEDIHHLAGNNIVILQPESDIIAEIKRVTVQPA